MDYKKITIDSYNRNADYHSEKFKSLMQNETFDKFIYLLNGRRILDLGCGAGEHSLYFKNKGFDVTPIDLSESMIKLCKDKGLNPILMDIENLDFGKNYFDGIWSVTSLLHIPKKKLENVVEKLNFITKDNGIIYACVKEGEGEGLVQDKVGDTERFFSFWQQKDLVDLFNPYFELIDNERKKLGRTVFLQNFFRKNNHRYSLLEHR